MTKASSSSPFSKVPVSDFSRLFLLLPSLLPLPSSLILSFSSFSFSPLFLLLFSFSCSSSTSFCFLLHIEIESVVSLMLGKFSITKLYFLLKGVIEITFSTQ